jgi:hypothetical protein
MIENAVLLFSGFAIGIISAFVASIPSILSPGSNVPLPGIILLIIFLIGTGISFTYTTAVISSRKDFLPVLKNE